MAEEAPTTEQPQETQSPLSLLAQQTFGDAYKGEVPDPEQPEEQPSEEPAAEEKTEEEQPEQEATDETSQEEEPEEVPISSLDELIEHYEWDPEWVNTLQVPVKVDGETSAVPLKDLVDTHQMNKAADKRLEDAKAKAQSQTQEIEQQREELQQKFVQAGTLIEKAEKLLDNDSSKINWDQLREDDPAEFSAKKAEFAERRQEIERMKQEAIDTYQKSVQDQGQQTEEARKQMQQQELQRLVEKVPEINSQDAYNDWSTNTGKYLTDAGFQKEELAGILDHRFYVLAHKARLHDEGQKKVETAKKKVVKVPKAAKPGPAQNQQKQADSRKVKQARERFKKNPTTENAHLLRKAQSGG